MNRLIYFLFFICIFNILYLIFNIPSYAQEMQSKNFKIQGGNFNMTSGQKESASFKLSDLVGQTAATTFASKGFVLQSGYLNNLSSTALSFTINPTTVSFSSLYPNTPIEKVISVYISNGNSPGYTVSVAQNQPLSTVAGAEIPDTSCDLTNPAPCTKTQTAKWSNNTTHGFGYKVTGRTVPADFQNPDFFRPFASLVNNETPAIIMTSTEKKVVDQATMVLKVNISPNQPVGHYRNVINFTAIAGI